MSKQTDELEQIMADLSQVADGMMNGVRPQDAHVYQSRIRTQVHQIGGFKNRLAEAQLLAEQTQPDPPAVEDTEPSDT